MRELINCLVFVQECVLKTVDKSLLDVFKCLYPHFVKFALLQNLMCALMVGFRHRNVILFLFDLQLLLGLLSDGIEAASALILKLLVQVSSFELVLHPLLNDLFKGFSASDVGEHNFLFVGFDV